MKKMLFCVVLLSLFVTACGGGNTGPDPTAPFKGGNKALELGLVEGMPPAAIQDNGMQFGVSLMIHNIGEHDIAADDFFRVYLEGFEPSRFGLSASEMSTDLNQALMGARKNFDGTIIPGQMTTVEFPSLSYDGVAEGNIVQNIQVKTCYDYQTLAVANLCYKHDTIQTTQDLCTLTGEKFPQNSGGPVHVSSLVQSPLGQPHEIMINFVVEHVGPGVPFGPDDSGETCSDSTVNMNRYRVGVTVESDSGFDIDCPQLTAGGSASTASGEVFLPNGAPTTVTCTIQGSTGDDVGIYTDSINVYLDYRYGEWILQPVVIQAVAGIGQPRDGRDRPVDIPPN